MLFAPGAGEAFGAALEAPPVDLAHARVVADQHPLDRWRAIEHALCECLKIRHRHDREPCAEGQTLSDTRRKAHAGKGARTAAEGDGAEHRQAHTGFVQQFRHHRQDGFSGAALEQLLALQQSLIEQQRRRAILGGGVDAENVHGAA